ncbi:MAG TPA: MerR family transcriptional regulator [Pyrinomonadaceae bacterium]|nr:MerR family transcriptional regulator [Pyrinomonadaceae bacterium]
MGYPATVIPEKIFFKIGEVCDLVGVQAHVLRYWETEFPMLSPQKNRSGQRTYRRRDVEIALRIKELLYDELFTIAGAKKKLQSELREASRLKIVHPSEPRENYIQPVQTPPAAAEEDFEDEPFDDEVEFEESAVAAAETNFSAPVKEEPVALNSERREALKSLASQLLELREMLKVSQTADENFHLRKY